MITYRFRLLVATLAALAMTSIVVLAQNVVEKPRMAGFTCVPLGVTGGLVNGNLSAYLVAAAGTHDYVCLDAGTLLAGLRAAVEGGAFPDLGENGSRPLEVAGLVMRQHIKAYLLSHAHFDHIAGLVISSPEDSPKPILALSPTIEALREHVFNGRVWANFADEGPAPALGRYHYSRLNPAEPAAIAGTGLTVRALPLSHGGPDGSTAFLLENRGQYLLYLGDVGPDEFDPNDRLIAVWRLVAPLIRSQTLRGIMLECSFADPRQSHELYGHMTPSWFFGELRRLACEVDPDDPLHALTGLDVIVTHIKPSLQGEATEVVVNRQLKAGNDLGVKLVFAHQGKRIDLRVCADP